MPTDTDRVLRAAVGLASRNIPVFPCSPNSKRPLTSRGYKDATVDRYVVEQFWKRHPNAMIGVPMGRVSGMVAIDVDVRDGKLGRESASKLRLSETLVAGTPSGGFHYYYKYPDAEDIRNQVNLEPGVDVRGEGGYTIFPPSIGMSGSYSWQIRIEPQRLPDHLLARLRKPCQPAVSPQTDGRIIQGRRNDSLFRFAARWRRNGMDADEIFAALRVRNQIVCCPPLSAQELKRIADSASRYDVQIDEAAWPNPVELPDELPEVPLLDADFLPETFKPWILDISERMQCPPDFPAVAAMIVTASVVGTQLAIRPKQHDDWTVIPNLWGAIVGRPGVLKSPALAEPMKLLRELEVDAKNVYEDVLKAHKEEKVVYLEQIRVLKEKLRQQIKDNIPHDYCEPASPEEPNRRRFIVNDPTVEALGVRLNENPHGLLLFRDELTGLLRSLDKQGQESARQFYLEAWNGDGRYTYDRIGRGVIDIETACVSILGGIQPGPLGAYLRTVQQGGGGDDGLIQRFQLIVWPDTTANWRNVDQWPDSEAKLAARRRVAELANLSPTLLKATVAADEIPFFRFGPEAQSMFDDWREELERRLRSGDNLAIIESHLAKYRSLVPTLALLIHLVDGGTNPVDVISLRKAIAWSVYLESHARRVYSFAARGDLEAAKRLLARIRRKDLDNPFSLRDVYRRGWMGLNTKKLASEAATILVDFDWLREARIEAGIRGGRPRKVYYVCPHLFNNNRQN